MTTDYTQQLASLQADIDRVQAQITQTEANIRELETELADFETRYNDIVKPLSDQLDAARKVLRTLEDVRLKQQMGQSVNFDDLWRSTNAQTQEPPTIEDEDSLFTDEKRKTGSLQDLKVIYRNLARRYHPDLATDEDDAARRTKIMAMINQAYQDEDYESLAALEIGTPSPTKDHPINSQISLELMTLRRLQHQYEELLIQLNRLQDREHELRYGSMMELKLEEKLAIMRGDDMLNQLADEMQTEYWEVMQAVDTLRTEIDA